MSSLTTTGIFLFEKLPPYLRSRFRTVWSSEEFRPFAEQYEEKIRKKLAQSSEAEDAADVIAELETASRLLTCDGFSVEYEPFGKSGVDFRVTHGEVVFHVETKRIRETAATVLYSRCLVTIMKAVKTVNSSLGVFVEFDGMDSEPELADALDAEIENVANEAVEIVKSLRSRLSDAQSERVPFRSFPDLHLNISHDPDKSPYTPTSDFGDVIPVLYSQKEELKFSDRILDALKQLVPNEPNALVIWSDSTTHEPDELPFAFRTLGRSILDGEEELFQKRKFASSHDVQNKLRNLSVAIGISRWARSPPAEVTNTVWVHPTPNTSIPAAVVEQLTRM